MKDFVIKGNGNSRYLKSALEGITTWEQFRDALAAGTLPVDLNGINPEGFQQLGDPLNKASLLKDSTAALLGLGTDAVPDDAFVALVLGQGVYGYRVRVQLADGTPVEGATVSGIQPLTGSTLVTGADGTVLGKSASASVTIGCTSPYIDQVAPASQSVTSTGTITDVILTLANNTDVLMITTSQTVNAKFSKMCTTYDVCGVGGGGGGTRRSSTTNPIALTGGGSGAGGGYTLGLDPASVESISATVGAAGNNSQTNANTTESYFTINGTQHQFSVTQDVNPGPATWTSASNGVHNGQNGVSGFHIFGDAALMVVGSSGGSGGAIRGRDSGTATGGTAGTGAGDGGKARVYSINDLNAGKGLGATNYGCGGGGGGYARDSNGNSTSADSGNGMQGACFMRFHFAA